MTIGMKGGQGNHPMGSSRPYIVKALHEWIVDSSLTPYLLVFADYPNAQVPYQYVDKGKIVLNISPSSVNLLVIDKTHIEFEARFRGILEYIYVPMNAVMAIYAKENGRGMAFDEEEDVPPPNDPPLKPVEMTDNAGEKSKGGKGKGGKGKGGRGHLTVVK